MSRVQSTSSEHEKMPFTQELQCLQMKMTQVTFQCVSKALKSLVLDKFSTWPIL